MLKKYNAFQATKVSTVDNWLTKMFVVDIHNDSYIKNRQGCEVCLNYQKNKLSD